MMEATELVLSVALAVLGLLNLLALFILKSLSQDIHEIRSDIKSHLFWHIEHPAWLKDDKK